MGEVIRTERGWVGHFILGHKCRYHRNTLLVSGQRRVVVSTVGNLFRDAEAREPMEVGHQRFYETMAFRAHKDGAYWEVDVSKPVSFESAWAISDLSGDVDLRADAMHESVVAEISAKLEAGARL